MNLLITASKTTALKPNDSVPCRTKGRVFKSMVRSSVRKGLSLEYGGRIHWEGVFLMKSMVNSPIHWGGEEGKLRSENAKTFRFWCMGVWSGIYVRRFIKD